jgi:hypothetical protein
LGEIVASILGQVRKQHEASSKWIEVHADYLLGLLLNPEDNSDEFL